jgi:hypothetical protein
VLDAIAPLRQWTQASSAEALHVFAPQGVYRLSRPAPIDFYVTDSVDHARVEILDGSGTVIRSLNTPASLTAGHHRLAWDLRTRGATVFPGMVLEAPSPARGVMVPPGTYTVRVTAGAASSSQRFVVHADPRLIDVTDADYAAQYALSIRLRDAASAANEAVLRIRAAKGRLGSSSGTATLVADLSAIEAQLYQVRNRSPKDKIANPIRLNDRLAGLLAIVQMGAGAPTAAQHQVADQLVSELHGLLAKLDGLLPSGSSPAS